MMMRGINPMRTMILHDPVLYYNIDLSSYIHFGKPWRVNLFLFWCSGAIRNDLICMPACISACRSACRYGCRYNAV